ncbi:hypothetical protein HYC85_003489 [Camellia sinensis]|uniref:Uncharacterized protein n=1 Tax=Camellia sinensis TaxID=4442 RepID=A0A7J7HW11_CAMSI|nr:hypothetical protein HYC85_003489 [Camellia sinensis]
MEDNITIYENEGEKRKKTTTKKIMIAEGKGEKIKRKMVENETTCENEGEERKNDNNDIDDHTTIDDDKMWLYENSSGFSFTSSKAHRTTRTCRLNQGKFFYICMV